MTVCERIDALLMIKKWSRRKLAIEAGIAPSSLQSAMQRNTTLSLDMLVPISRTLGVNVSSLLEGEALEEIAKQMGIPLEAVYSVIDKDGNSEAQKKIIAVHDAISMDHKTENIITELEAQKDDPKDIDLLAAYRKLNKEGQKIAIERVEELTLIPKYRHTEPPEAPEAEK